MANRGRKKESYTVNFIVFEDNKSYCITDKIKDTVPVSEAVARIPSSNYVEDIIENGINACTNYMLTVKNIN